MPAPLTAINNTYTANTASGVRACLYFLQRQSRLRENRDRRTTDTFRAHPISLVYGYGSVANGDLNVVGDDLDIIPTVSDRVRRRRWWDAPNPPSKQMLLPFPAYNRARVMSVNRYDYATEVVVQFGQDRHTQLNLSAPTRLGAPGPYTLRAIRIHNVDGSETVPPMRPSADEVAHTAYVAGDAAVSGMGRTRGGGSDYARMVNNGNQIEDAPPIANAERERPIPMPQPLDLSWDVVDECSVRQSEDRVTRSRGPARMARSVDAEPSPVEEVPCTRAEARGWGWGPSYDRPVPCDESAPLRETEPGGPDRFRSRYSCTPEPQCAPPIAARPQAIGPSTRRVIRRVPINDAMIESRTRAQIDSELSRYQECREHQEVTRATISAERMREMRASQDREDAMALAYGSFMGTRRNDT
jgi:hypothetical protein